MAKHAGQVARAERSAGCRGMRKVWRGEAASRRALVEKEGGGVRARGLGGGRREAGMEASGQAGEACRWHAAWERGRAGARADVEVQTTERSRASKGHAMPLICRRSLRLIFLPFLTHKQ